ncbi:MAG: xanthine dehydrogenase family protein subunit M [Lautropia sp.]
MKSAAFDYVRPDSLAEALAILEARGPAARVLAGGQSLLAMMNLRLATPELLIDIGRVPGLRGIARDGDRLRVGALVTHAALASSAEIAACVPLLAQAVPHVAHAAIRNAGTIGGSLALADPAAEYPAVALALDARIVLASTKGERTVAASDYFLGLYETAMRDDELLLATEWPCAAPGDRGAFLELARRRGDYAMVGVAATASLRGGRVDAARIAWLSVADRPLLTVSCADAVVGTSLDAAAIAAARTALAVELAPHVDRHPDAATRRHLAGVLLERALRAIAASAGADGGES